MRSNTFLVLAALLAATFAPQARAEQPKQIVFVCLHGSVKSQMAAAYFNDIAKKRGLPYVAISRGIEPDSSIPPRIRDGLAGRRAETARRRSTGDDRAGCQQLGEGDGV